MSTFHQTVSINSRLLKGFHQNTQGNIAVTFALALLPVLAAIGCAVDYSVATNIRSKLTSAADSAILASVNQQAMKQTTSDARLAALSMFGGLTETYKGFSLTSSEVIVTDVGFKRTATLTFTASVPTSFMGVVGKPTVVVGGSTTAESARPAFIDFYLLLDNTPSMGIGATPADVATMVKNTSDKCAFACHDLNDKNNYYNLAKKLGVTMRIDVVRSATQNLTDTASKTATVDNQFRMAIYSFGDSAATAGLTTISALNSSMSSVKNAAGNIDLMTVKGQGQFDDTDTDYDRIFPAIKDAIPSPGDGSTAEKPQKVLFFVSDGVADEFNASGCTQPTLNGDGRCQEPITVSLCQAIKDKGIKIAVLYTTYLALTTNDWYNNTIAPFNAGPFGPSPNSKIAQNMEKCASPGLYFEVSPTDGISQAMDALFTKTVSTARITN